MPPATKDQLLDAYRGKPIDALPTPSLLIDRPRFVANCERMTAAAKALGVPLRAHIKTHKTLEGARHEASDGRIIVSTLAEAHGVLPLVEEGVITDVCYGFPVPKLKIPECAELNAKIPKFRVMVDSVEQVNALAEHSGNWSVFVKVDMGYGRAGLNPELPVLHQVFAALKEHKEKVEFYGMYCHAGHSYSSHSIDEAREYLFKEVSMATKASRYASAYGFERLVLSVGATPTAHAIKDLDPKYLPPVGGELELHAGNYACCDLQQVATGCVALEDVAIFGLAEVVSSYPGRGTGSGEMLINAGVLALAREKGPIPGFGNLVHHPQWHVGRISQEHGILVTEDENAPFLEYGTKVQIVPQHACIIAANFEHYFVIDDGIVTDVWTPIKYW